MKHEVISEDHSGLAWNFHVNPSSCDNPTHYEEYIRLCALQDYISGTNTTHVFIDTENNKMCGYITLRATSLIIDDGEEKRGYPAIEISELAVDLHYERRGIGSMMILFTYLKAIELSECRIGIEYITLCADPKAEGFYRKSELKFEYVRDYYDLPRNGWNKNCTPMFLRIKNGPDEE